MRIWAALANSGTNLGGMVDGVFCMGMGFLSRISIACGISYDLYPIDTGDIPQDYSIRNTEWEIKRVSKTDRYRMGGIWTLYKA